MASRPSLLLLLSVFTTALFLSACEDSVDPILENNRQFTLFGTLDMNQDTQFVRVIPIRTTLRPDPDVLNQIAFASTDLTSGETRVWDDSLLTFEDGTVGLVFYAPLRIRPGHTYRIEVTSPLLELTTVAETTVPEQPTNVMILPAELSGGTGGAIGRGSQTVRWNDLGMAPFAVDVWYRFLPAEAAAFRDVRMPYTPDNVQEGADWLVELDLRQDRLALDTIAVDPNTVPLAGVGVLLTVLDGAFVPPGGTFDPEILAQPGTFSNVENGFGFVGSVGRFAAEWVFEDDTYEVMNYLTVEEVFGRGAVAPYGSPFPVPATPVPVQQAGQ